MFKYSTPTHEFYLCIDPREWTKFVITYTQHDTIILEKTEADRHTIGVCEDCGYVLSIKLTEDETALFNSKEKAYVQIKCAYDNGDIFVSNKETFTVSESLNKTKLEG